MSNTTAPATEKMSDETVARKFLNKIAACKKSGTEFRLTFAEFKRVITAKRCKYTGILLTDKGAEHRLQTDVTIDRIDNSKGYVPGNVAACCHGYNSFKAVLENPNNVMTFKILEGALKAQKKLQGGAFKECG